MGGIGRDEKQGTLGGLLYADRAKQRVSEEEWVALVRAIAARDQIALRALYQRAHRLVFTLALRLTDSRETAEELTVDVFHDIWRRAGSYDPAAGTVLGWIMNQARSRSIDRIRFETRKKRVAPPEASLIADVPQSLELSVAQQDENRLLEGALTTLTAKERRAVETAYLGEMSYAETAGRLGAPLGTIKTRIRSALMKLRKALTQGDTL
jgi:RNA polymerase sigma-70 factor (ECF subfamily)